MTPKIREKKITLTGLDVRRGDGEWFEDLIFAFFVINDIIYDIRQLLSLYAILSDTMSFLEKRQYKTDTNVVPQNETTIAALGSLKEDVVSKNFSQSQDIMSDDSPEQKKQKKIDNIWEKIKNIAYLNIGTVTNKEEFSSFFSHLTLEERESISLNQDAKTIINMLMNAHLNTLLSWQGSDRKNISASWWFWVFSDTGEWLTEEELVLQREMEEKQRLQEIETDPDYIALRVKVHDFCKELGQLNTEWQCINAWVLHDFLLSSIEQFCKKGRFDWITRVIDTRIADIKWLMITNKDDTDLITNSIGVFISGMVSYANHNNISLPKTESEVKKEVLPQYSPHESMRWMSNTTSRISEITVWITNSDDKEMIMLIKNFLYAKKDESDFVVRCSYPAFSEWEILQKEEDILLQFTEDEQEKIDLFPVKISYLERWTRDGALMMNDGTIIESKYHYQSRDREMYDNLAITTWSELIQSDLIFQWWNIRQTANTAYIWYDDIKVNMNIICGDTNNQALEHKYSTNNIYTQEQLDTVIQKFQKLLSKDIVIVWMSKNMKGFYDAKDIPKEAQPIFHIDLFFTPLDDNTIVMADVDALDNKYKWFVKKVMFDMKNQWKNIYTIPSPNNVSSQDPLLYFYSFNNSVLEDYVTQDWKVVKRAYVPQYYQEDRRYNNIVEDMKDASGQIILSDEKWMRESKEKLKEVWKWQYELCSFYDEARKVYESLWYTVVPIPISSSIRSSGAVNCRTFEKRTTD